MALKDDWSPSPDFSLGQALSSSAHLNALVRNEQVILGEYLSPTPSYGSPKLGVDFHGIQQGSGTSFYGYYRLFVGVCRHKRDTFTYVLTVHSTFNKWVYIRIRCGEEAQNISVTRTIAPNVVADYQVTGILSLSAIAADNFYEVFVDVWASEGQGTDAIETEPSVSITYLGETYTIPAPNIATFNTGVPTPEQWQALSDYTDLLYTRYNEPIIPAITRFQLGPNSAHNDWTTGNDGTARYMIRHRHRYLAYQFHVNPGEFKTNKTLTGRVYVNNQLAVEHGFSILSQTISKADTTLRFSAGGFGSNDFIQIGTGEIIKLGTYLSNNDDPRFENCLRAQHGTVAAEENTRSTSVHEWMTFHHKDAKKDYFPIKDYVTYRGIIDLDALPVSLAVGTYYANEVRIHGEAHFSGDDDTGLIYVDYLFETPSAGPYLSGWVPLTNHQALTTPRTTAQNLRNNLTWLYARSHYVNYVSPNLSLNYTDRGGFFARRRRYLFYYTMSEDQDGTLTYYVNGREQTQGISPGNYRWNILDMDSVDGLYPGTIYRVTGVSYAFEDDKPMPIFDLDLEEDNDEE